MQQMEEICIKVHSWRSEREVALSLNSWDFWCRPVYQSTSYMLILSLTVDIATLRRKKEMRKKEDFFLTATYFGGIRVGCTWETKKYIILLHAHKDVCPILPMKYCCNLTFIWVQEKVISHTIEPWLFL